MKTGKLEHIHVKPDTEKGSRGASVTWRKKEGEGKNPGAWLRTETEQQKSHTTPEEAGAHVTSLLNEHFGSGGDTKNTPTPGVKEGKSAYAPKSHPASDDGPDPSHDSYD
jgi:hypothetical protein